MIYFILVINGIYDIICACCILWLADSVQPFIFMANLHPSIFIEEKYNDTENPLVHSARRLLAYWLFTYGFVRVYAGIKKETSLVVVAAATYFLEAFCYEYERLYLHTGAGAAAAAKITFVSSFSVLLGIFVLLGSHTRQPTLVFDYLDFLHKIK